MFNLEELQEAMENLEKSKPSKEDIHVAFDRELVINGLSLAKQGLG